MRIRAIRQPVLFALLLLVSNAVAQDMPRAPTVQSKEDRPTEEDEEFAPEEFGESFDTSALGEAPSPSKNSFRARRSAADRVFDTGGVAVDDSKAFELHGRIDLSLQHAKLDDMVEGLSRGAAYELSQAAVLLLWKPLEWLRFLAELELGLPKGGSIDLEVDIMAIELTLPGKLPRLRAGVSYVPFGVERFRYAPPRNSFVNRPMAFRRIYPGSYTDLGLFLSGSIELPLLPKLAYEGAIVSGLRGPDRKDRPTLTLGNGRSYRGIDNGAPLVAGRAGAVFYENIDDPSRTPLRIELGASALTTNYDRLARETLTLLGADFRLRIAGLRLRTEIVRETVDSHSPGGHRSLHGHYLELVYRGEPREPWVRSWHIGFRYGQVDSDDARRNSGDLERWSGSLGWEPSPRLLFKLQLDVVRELSNDHQPNNRIALLQLGYSF